MIIPLLHQRKVDAVVVESNVIVDKALEIATAAHEGQLRKWTNTPEPYITHPIRVAKEVSNYIKWFYHYEPDEQLLQNVVAAALLHDVVEDTQYPLDKIREAVGDEVLNIVMELTDDVFPEGTPRDYKFGVAVKKWYGLSSSASMIKLADRIDNLSDAQNAPKRWLDKYLVESDILYCVLGERHPRLGAALKSRVDELTAALLGKFFKLMP